MEVAARHSRHSPLQVGVGVRRDRRECRESTGREPSCPPIAGDIRLFDICSLPSSRVAAPPGVPFAGDHAAAIPSPVDQVHMSRPGVPCVCLVVPTGTF